MKIDDKLVLRILKLIETESGLEGMDFGRGADDAEALYGRSDDNPRTTKKLLGVSRSERDYHLDYLTKKEFVTCLRLLRGDWTAVRLTPEGHDYISLLQNDESASTKVVSHVMEKFGWPVLVGAAVVAIGIYLGINP